MKTIVYMNNDQIQILSLAYEKSAATPKLDVELKIDLPSGSVINGVILDGDAIVSALEPHSKLLENTTVVINSSNIYVKKLMVPELTEKQLLTVVENEFSLTDDNKELVYDFSSYKIGKTNAVLCCAVSLNLISRYAEVFQRAKIVPKKFDIIQNAITKFVKNQDALKAKTFVLNVIEGSHMLSVLFENGEYVLANRNAILAEENEAQRREQLFSYLSAMIQFNLSEKSDHPIEASYYVGLSDSELSALSRTASERLTSVEIKGIDQVSSAGFPIGKSFYPYAASFDKKRDINLFNLYKKHTLDVQIKKDKKIVNPLLIAAAVLFLILGSFLYLKLSSFALSKENAGIKDYLAKPAAEQAVKTALRKSTELNNLKGTLLEVAQYQKQDKKANVLTSTKLNQILLEAAKSVTLTNIEFDLSKNTLIINGTGGSEYSSAAFITNLKATKLFSNIEYTGYQSNGQNIYTFNAICTLK